MTDIIKALVIAGGYLALAPALGWFLAQDRRRERFALAILFTMPSWFPGKLTLMLGSVELYRGHTKGFEASLIEVLAVALIVCAALRRPAGFRWLPPGAWLYLLWCALSCLSLFGATNRSYVLMAAFKFTKALLIYVGVFQAVRDEEDLRWIGYGLAFSLGLQALVGLKLRFLDGMWQVKGWFEHQNPMAMWAYMAALPVFALALAPTTKPRDTLFYLGGVAAATLLILLSVSRAALAAFAVGAVMVILLAMARGFTLRLGLICALGAAGTLVVSTVALNSLRARLAEVSSREEEHDLRDILNTQSRAMLHDHPLGVGWNNFGVANSLPVDRYARILMDWDQSRGFRLIDENYLANPLTESLYWLLLAETGYPGFAAFVVFEAATVWWMIRTLLKNWRQPAGHLLGGLLVALTLTYLHGTVERVLSQTKNLSLWLMCAGCVARMESERRQGRRFGFTATPSPGGEAEGCPHPLLVAKPGWLPA